MAYLLALRNVVSISRYLNTILRSLKYLMGSRNTQKDPLKVLVTGAAGMYINLLFLFVIFFLMELINMGLFIGMISNITSHILVVKSPNVQTIYPAR